MAWILVLRTCTTKIEGIASNEYYTVIPSEVKRAKTPSEVIRMPFLQSTCISVFYSSLRKKMWDYLKNSTAQQRQPHSTLRIKQEKRRMLIAVFLHRATWVSYTSCNLRHRLAGREVKCKASIARPLRVPCSSGIPDTVTFRVIH